MLDTFTRKSYPRYLVSSDNGETWRPATEEEVPRRCDGGAYDLDTDTVFLRGIRLKAGKV